MVPGRRRDYRESPLDFLRGRVLRNGNIHGWGENVRIDLIAHLFTVNEFTLPDVIDRNSVSVLLILLFALCFSAFFEREGETLKSSNRTFTDKHK